MAHFDSVTQAPADPILSLTEAFKADSNPEKINLSVGVFVDDNGKTPTLKCVLEAEKRIQENPIPKGYLPMTGTPKYAALTQEICFGKDLQESLGKRIVTAQTPGGTGALRVAGDFIAKNIEPENIWLSNPTWANHGGIFKAASLAPQSYNYFDKETLGLDYEAFIKDLKEIPAGDVVVLHACCHNPTGADLSPEQWDEVAALATVQGWIPLLDFAYQGFGTDLETDAYGVRAFAASGVPFFVSQSFSKNLGLYHDRVGAIHVVTSNDEEAGRVASQVKISIRTNYSNPPAHGGRIVEEILSDDTLRSQWVNEVADMRSRIHKVRANFATAMAEAGINRDFSFLNEQNGMFSFTGFTKEQAIALREEHSIYIVDSGRINVAGITEANLPKIVQAIKSLLD
ncbi:aspartate/tyrosine/aromatic aminotransferase [Puniceicoccaceae bacterium K14]|nr:aspartate/tyrosine/aromatic aminotransferase [Puniceicoccaceae bacterium K14]